MGGGRKHTCLDKCTRQDELPQYDVAGPGEYTEHQDCHTSGETTSGGLGINGIFELGLKNTTQEMNILERK